MIKEQSAGQVSNFLYSIRWLRGHFGISKKRMAQPLGISVRSLNSLESGIIPYRVETELIFRLHGEFRYPMGSLFAVRLPHEIPVK